MEDKVYIEPHQIWSAHSGYEYLVLGITNLAHMSDKYPPVVVYQGRNGNLWSKTLPQFFKTMTLVQQCSEHPRGFSDVKAVMQRSTDRGADFVVLGGVYNLVDPDGLTDENLPSVVIPDIYGVDDAGSLMVIHDHMNEYDEYMEVPLETLYNLYELEHQQT